MAKRTSTNPITSSQVDWTLDTSNNLPYSGQSIQNYIRSRLGQIESPTSGLDAKYGAVYFDGQTNTMYLFKSNEDKASWLEDSTQSGLVMDSFVISVNSSLLYRILPTNNNGTTEIQVSSNASSLNLSLDFDVQMSTIGSDVWTSTGQSVYVYLRTIDLNNQSTEIQLDNNLLFAGQRFEYDVMPLLPIGTTRVEVKFVSEQNSSNFITVTYVITVSEMYIELFNDNWKNAIVEPNVNYQIGGFRIIGSMYKTLHIELYKANELKESFEIDIGTTSYSDTPYNFTKNEGFDLSESNLQTGIYVVKAYLTSNNLSSLPVIYNVMYVREEDKLLAHLVCVNNAAESVYNYATSKLCDYAIYNEGKSTGNPHIKLDFVSGSTPEHIYDNTVSNIDTGVAHEYSYTIEWLTDKTINIFADLVISLGEDVNYSEQHIVIPIDNSATYPAESGAAFYLNTTTRSNGDSNKENVVNDATYPATEIQCTWNKMSWVNGIDGWTTDKNGRKCLLIPARSSVTIPYQVFTGENISFELCYKISNVSDYSENAITIATNPTSSDFKGIIIKPTNLIIHSNADIDASKDTERGTSFEDEETIHLLVTISGGLGNSGNKNLVTGYINGSVGFQFEYVTGTAWDHVAPIIIGSQTADIQLYLMRVYRKVLGKVAVERNYINSLETLPSREQLYNEYYSIVKETSHVILYEDVQKTNKNYFVVEMLDGLTIPSRANNWSKDTKGKSNFEMHFGEHPLWDFKLYNVETSGQGTTSMDYYRWNLRFRIDKSNDSKKVDVAYYDAPTVRIDGSKEYHEQTSYLSKTVYFDGGANQTPQNHPAVKRITAKINFASSMQSHKIGATRAYNDIRNALNISNAAQDYAIKNDLPVPTTAVYQYPAYGFVKHVSPQGVVSYEFIGLFTIGPDKGDKPTFGYDIHDDVADTLITLEGTDHSRRMAKFNYPWNANVEYRSSNECINIVLGENDFDNAWEVSNCYGLSTDKLADQAAIQSQLLADFKPAYDVVYNNSTLILPIALNTYGVTAEATLAAINADISNFQKTPVPPKNRLSYADYEFWIEGEYVLYYYDIKTRRYVAGINLVTDLGTPEGSTLAEKNEWFKQQRINRFKSVAETYWDIQDAIYHWLFVIIFGATDNFAKNTYPYKMGCYTDEQGNIVIGNGKWQWRQDDLDTIFDIDNTGGQTKPYYIEFEDGSAGTAYFAGSNSVFWNLIYEAYWNNYGVNKGIESLGKDFLDKMATLGTGSNKLDGCINFIKKYFWDNAQNYFNSAAYNVDAVWKYETAWLTSGQSVDPLKQSLGNHLSAEKLWVRRRLIYMMSLFKAGPFESYADKTLGSIEFRPYQVGSISVTPVYSIYPALTPGAGSPAITARTTGGSTYTFTGLDAEGNTTYYIKNTDLLSSVGDLKNLVFANSYVQNLTIESAKLRTFKIGDTTGVTTNVPGLNFVRTACLETINAKNASSIQGALDLTDCTRLVSADFGGTSLTQINLPSGSKIETLVLPNSTINLIFKNLKFLENLTLPSNMANIRGIQVENCTYQDGLTLLRTVYNQNNSALQYIRVIWSDPKEATVEDLSMLANIATNKDKDGNTKENTYGGYNTTGTTTGTPVIEGTLLLTTGIYSSHLDAIGVMQEEDYGEGLKRAKTESFGTLYIIYDPTKIYILFEDPVVRNLCITNYASDGYGVTLNDAAAIPNGNYDFIMLFRGNTNIETFDEYKYFTGQVDGPRTGQDSYQYGMFENCTSLTSVTLPDTTTRLGYTSHGKCFNGATNLETVKGNCRLTEIGNGCFAGCTSLTSVPSLQYVERVNDGAFNHTDSLEIDLNLPNLTAIDINSFRYSGIKRILSLGTITQFNGGISGYPHFGSCPNLKSVILPRTLLNFNYSSIFSDCSSLEWVDFNNASCATSSSAFSGCNALAEIRNFSNITTLADDLFGNNTNKALTIALTSSSFPEVTHIGRRVFRGMSNITGTLHLPKLNTFNIDGYQFAGTGIEHITSLGNIINIQQNAFMDCTSLTDVAFAAVTTSDKVITLSNYAFQGCTSLTTVTNSNNTKPSGKQCFYNCDLSNYTIASTTTSVAETAFRNNTNMTWFDFNNASCAVANDALRGCSSLQEIRNYSNITSIGQYAFSGAPLSIILSSSSFPELTSLARDNFTNNTNVTGVVHLPKLTSLGSSAFYGTGISSITSLGNVTNLNAGNEFQNCISLTTVTMPTHYINLAGNTFNGCTNLTTINNSDYIATIGSRVFQGCSSLTSFKLINSTISVGGFAFAYCSSLTTFDCNHATVSFTLDNVFTGCTSITTFLNTENIVSTPGDWAGNVVNGASFKNSLVWNLTNQSLPNLVTLGNNTFNGCSGVTGTVYLPSLTGTVGTYSFYRTGIQHITNLGSVTTLNINCFSNCSSLIDAVLPATVTTLAEGVLRYNKALVSVEMNSTTPPTIHNGAFGNVNNDALNSADTALEAIYVPDASLTAYRLNTATGYYNIRGLFLPKSEKGKTITRDYGNYETRKCLRDSDTVASIPASDTSIDAQNCALTDYIEIPTGCTGVLLNTGYNVFSPNTYNNDATRYTVFAMYDSSKVLIGETIINKNNSNPGTATISISLTSGTKYVRFTFSTDTVLGSGPSAHVSSGAKCMIDSTSGDLIWPAVTFTAPSE